MSIVTITLCDKNFQLSCKEENKSKLLSLAEKLDSVMGDIRKNNLSASFELTLIIAALSLIDDKNANEQKTAGEILEKSEQEFQKLLSSIDLELKTVAKKIENC
jgi:cell division protein ZapA